jgi:hypothetical protein
VAVGVELGARVGRGVEVALGVWEAVLEAAGWVTIALGATVHPANKINPTKIIINRFSIPTPFSLLGQKMDTELYSTRARPSECYNQSLIPPKQVNN